MKTYYDLYLYIQKELEKENMDKNIARIILEDLLSSSGADFYLFLKEKINEKIEGKALSYLARVLKKEPIQYILGYTYFYGNKIFVDNNVLIPRFDTENLVEIISKDFNNKNYNIADLGTGSGCIAISLKKLNSNFNFFASDIDRKIVEMAKKNAKANNVSIEFFVGNMLDPYIEKKIKLDIIVSNPPYIDYNDQEIDLNVKNHEPFKALFANNNGLEYYDEILRNAPKVFQNRGVIYFEIGYKQKKEVLDLVKKYYKKNSEVESYKDLSGLDRVIKIYLYDLEKNYENHC
ncbi:MAG: peptide chain release factor N(5)-glutamine methyltransferase [Bacilli bacterium]|nr:peptide chain release factor N(5)-glutamine methyltransferase [Bacilli bacterium]